MKPRIASDADVSLARCDERDVLANLFQLYVHDFSEHWAGAPRGDLQAAVAGRNTGALAFWRKAIARQPLARDVEDLYVSANRWAGTILRFRFEDAAVEKPGPRP